MNQELKISRTDPDRQPILYKHLHEQDTFYDLTETDIAKLPASIRGMIKRTPGTGKPKVRVTINKEDGAVAAQVIKVRLRDLHVYCPNHRFDYRISVNAELNWPFSVDNLKPAGEDDRKKDRMSYRHQMYRIDLTQVSALTVTHELEVEVDADVIRQEGQMLLQGEKSSNYEEIVKGFVDNVRILARKNT